MDKRQHSCHRMLLLAVGYLTVVVLLLSVVGCNAQETVTASHLTDTETQYSMNMSQLRPLLGVWTAQSVTVGDTVYTIQEYSERMHEDISNTYTLREDGTVILSFMDKSLEGTYTYDGNAVEALFGGSRYRLVYDAKAATLTRVKEATDEVITYRKAGG